MQVNFGELKEGSAGVASAIADARSARNLASRRRAEEEHEEREAERAYRRRKRKSERELEELLRRTIKVRVRPEERPEVGTTTARKLYHRTVDLLIGTTGLSDARGADGLHAIHFAFTARGFASTKGRRWRRGEAERAARYNTREDALEGGERGWWSNIATDRNELVAFYRSLEALERHDRSNANVYISEILELPHEISARQRRKAVRRICRFFDSRGLPYTVAIHLPDRGGDQRNYHVHIIYSLRPCTRHSAYDWSFGVSKVADINTPAGIKARRLAVVEAINTTLRAAKSAKRYTHLSNAARGMAAGKAKTGQKATWVARRLQALEERAVRLEQLSTMVSSMRNMIVSTFPRLQRQKVTAAERLRNLRHSLEISSFSRSAALKAVVAERLAVVGGSVTQGLADRQHAVGGMGARLAARLKSIAGVIAEQDTSRPLRARIAANEQLHHVHKQLLQDAASRQSRFTQVRAALDQRLFGQTELLRQVEGEREPRLCTSRNRALRNLRLENRAESVVAVVRHASRLMQPQLAAVHAFLNGCADRLLAGTSRDNQRLASLGAIAKKRENGVRLAELQAAITEAGADYHMSVAQLAKAADLALSYTSKAISGRITEGTERLRCLGDTAIGFAAAERAEHSTRTAELAAVAAEAQRGSERRKAIATAAWRLRRASFPPQVVTPTGFSIASRATDLFCDVDRFEGEEVIQKVHKAKRAQMIAAVRRKIEGAERSPFIERDGKVQLPRSTFDGPLRRAVELAKNDPDLVQIFRDLLRLWLEREAIGRKAREQKERQETERRDRLRPGVQQIFDAIGKRVADGRYPRDAVKAMESNVETLAKAVGEGRLLMRSRGDKQQFYFASAGLRTITEHLSSTRIGREIVVALGKLTLDEPFETAEASFSWVMPPLARPESLVRPLPAAEIDVRRTKGSAER